MTDRHQLLILYRHGPAKADELRWCLRSLANVTECNPVPLVVGDPPDWYVGPQIRMDGAGGRRADVCAKLRAIIASELVAEQFVLLADDNVIVRPMSFGDLMIPRSQRPRTEPSDGWHGLRFATAEFCRSRGWPVVDLSTHWPYCWSKGRLAATLEILEPEPRHLLVESVYASMHSQAHVDARVDFRYVSRGTGWCEDAKVISYGDAAFIGGLRSRLAVEFPDPSPWETGPVPEVPIVGRISPQAQHACRSLGRIARVDGGLPIHACERYGECGPFGGHQTACDSCVHYAPNPGRVIRIGGADRTAGRTVQRCGR